jgi:hypothetical protein
LKSAGNCPRVREQTTETTGVVSHPEGLIHFGRFG